MIITTDIAFKNLGWVAIEGGTPVAFGVITTEKDKRKNVKVADDYATRCMSMAAQFDEVVKKYQPKGILGELPHGSQNAIASKLLGGAVMGVCAIATCHNVPCEWISEGDSKKAALGKRSAVKEETMDWVRERFPDIDWPKTKGKFEHIADALMAYNGLKNGTLVRAFG